MTLTLGIRGLDNTAWFQLLPVPKRSQPIPEIRNRSTCIITLGDDDLWKHMEWVMVIQRESAGSRSGVDRVYRAGNAKDVYCTFPAWNVYYWRKRSES